jgi:hypothetical protein
MKINLTANNANEQRVLDYLEVNASDVLAEKINTGKKTLKGFFVYARGEAQKLAINGCACVEDQTVFGWAIHYFEEEEIKELATPQESKAVLKATEAAETPVKAQKVDKPTTRTGKTKKDENQAVSGQMSLFDSLFGGAK